MMSGQIIFLAISLNFDRIVLCFLMLCCTLDSLFMNYTRFQNYATSLKNTLLQMSVLCHKLLLKIANGNKQSKDILNRI